MTQDLLDKIVSLAKRRGFVFPGSEIYGGLANTWDYGPLGVELKNNIKNLWWKKFVHERSDIVGIDSALLMNTKVWEASGHLEQFSDTLVECKSCHERFRADQLSAGDNVRSPAPNIICPTCGGKDFTEPKKFNLMLKTFLGPTEDAEHMVYFRPETAQGMFINFKNVLDTMRVKIPFGIAQVGKAFRNEITPGNFIFRTREFEQMEIEYFIPPPQSDKEWEAYFNHWQAKMREWLEAIGIDLTKIHEREVPEEGRAHYSKRTIDFDYEFPFGREELYGLAYRSDFDLRNHEKFSGQNLKYRDPETGEEYWPHVIEPTWGVDRSVLAVLLEAYTEEKDRVVLKLKPYLAPYKVAVFPLLANKPELVAKAQTLQKTLKPYFTTAFDDRGNIGKRYYSQDEIGTPFCVTVDFQTLEDDTLTVRDRDTMEQDRVAIVQLEGYLNERLHV